jgi:hypothetical protein
MLVRNTSQDNENKTDLANVTKLTAVAAERHTTVLDIATGSKALEVLGRALGPALCHLGTTRLFGKLNGEDVLATGIADEVNDSHVGSNFLLLGDEINTKTVLTESLFDGGKVEIFHDSAGVSLEGDTESVEVLVLGGIDEGSPGGTSLHLRNTGPVDDTTRLALESFVAFLVAEPALHRVGRAVTSSMAVDATRVTSTSELALNSLVGTVRLVVADLTAVVALSSHAAALGLVWAIASEVTGLSATIIDVSIEF